ncbi:MAG: hypothetical protein LQ346_000693 [Caloplaca aetnensis]|nr:MAG: hypothetical protein LQ346_000693 [Caloplaca aetnensis]
MSSRALRKIQREQEQQKQVKHASAEEKSEDEPPIQPKKLNAFDMLSQAEDQPSTEDEDERETDAVDVLTRTGKATDGNSSPVRRSPKVKPKLKKKKKAKKQTTDAAQLDKSSSKKDISRDTAGLDEIDIALKSLSTHPSTQGVTSVSPASHETFPEMYQLLAIDSKSLNAANEMKRLFGNVALEDGNDEPGPGRRRGRVQHLDLGGALAGRNSPISRGQGLAGLALRRNVFVAGKEEWPKATSGGLGMELVERLNDGTTEYRFLHNTIYQDVQRQFENCVESLDPQRLIHLLQFNPYHISTLLQVSEIAKQQGDHSVSGDLIERALFSFGRAVQSSFVTALSEGKARMDFRRPENREFWLAAWRYVSNLGQRGTWRTSYEWAKLVLSLDPEGDPYCVAINLDQLALRGGQTEHFLKLCGCAPLDSFLKRPNLRISSALAKYRIKDAQGSRSQLREAIANYPYIFTRLFQELNLEYTPKSIWGQVPQTDREKFECEVYVHNAKDLWNTPEAISLLVEVAESAERGLPALRLDQEITLDEARHILLSGAPTLINLLPRGLTTLHTTSSDPVPPTENLLSYSSATADDVSQALESADRQPIPPAVPAALEGNDSDGEDVRELNSLQNFFSRFLPWIESRETSNQNEAFHRAAAESGEPEEVIRQRGNRLVQLLQRVVGMDIDTSLHVVEQTTGTPNATSTEIDSADGDGSDDDQYAQLPDLIPAGGIPPTEPATPESTASESQAQPYDDERNQRWLAGQGMLRVKEFATQHGADESAWGSHAAEGEALISEYAERVRQLRQQRTRDFIINYSLRQGTSAAVRDLVLRYVSRSRL